MLQSYFGILATFLIAGSVALLFVFLSQTLGPKKPNPVKNTPYECGVPPFEAPAGRHNVRFYLAGMLFVIFDVELIFLFPWAVVFKQIGWAGFWAMMLYLGIFELGFLYAWRNGAFEWK